MAEKELPPLYVKILGDDSQFQKKLNDIVNDVAKLAQRLNESINNAVKTSNAGIATAEAEKQRRLEDAHKSRMAALDVKHADQKAIRDAKLQQAQNTAAIKVAASQAKADDERQRRQAKSQSDQLLQQQRIATEQARTDSIHTKTMANVDQAAKTAARARARINNRINLDMTESAARTADIKLKSLAKVRQINQKTIDEHKKSLADIDAKNKESAARAAVITAKGASTAAGITLKANAVAAASARRAAASAAATAAKAAAAVAATQAKSAATTAKIAAQTNYINLQAQMAQTIGQQKLNNMQKQAQQSAAKHSQSMLKSQQQMILAARKAARDDRMHLLHMRNMRLKMAREEESHKQKMRIQEEVHQKRMNSKYYTTHPDKTSSSSAMSGMGSGLTARADIYMHANALRALAESGRGILDLYANFREAQAGIEVFTGSAQKAQAIMADLMEFAQKTPYNVSELAKETRNLMARGMAADMATESLKRLGAVAGGDIEKLKHLSYGFGQIMTAGKLLQQDLRQLQEQGWNPLRTIARLTMKPMQTLEERLREVEKAKEDGLITSKHVLDALRAETSAGGQYADLLNKMSMEVKGLAARLREMFDELKIDAMRTLDGEMKKALKTAIYYVGMAKDWIKADKERATRMIMLAVQVGKAVLAFHLLGLAIAVVRWWATSVLSIFAGLRAVLTPVIMLFRAMGTVMLGLRMMGTGAMLAIRMSIMGVVAAIRVHNAVTATMWALSTAAWARWLAVCVGWAAAMFRVIAITRAYMALGLYSNLMGAIGAIYLAVASLRLYNLALLYTAVRARAVAVATALFSVGLKGIRASLVGIQIASVAAWASFLGPVALIVGALGLIVAVVWNVVEAIGGEGGFTGAFTRAWAAMKWFFGAAYGFFANFGHNVQIIAKYVYDNWYSLFSDMLKIIVGFVMALPNNLLVMWKMGMRLTVAFGTWLIAYLPNAIYNAFVAGFNFVKGMFQKLLDAGKAVWEFITTPSKWADGASSVSNFIAQLGADAKSVNENGLMETAKNIINEERKNLQTGMEGVTFTSPTLEGLKLDIPKETVPPEPETLPPPEAFTPDFSGMDGPGGKATKGKKGADYKVQDAISANSGDYTKRMAEYMDRVRGMKAGATSDPKLQAQQRTNQLLQRIEKNTQQTGPEIETADIN